MNSKYLIDDSPLAAKQMMLRSGSQKGNSIPAWLSMDSFYNGSAIFFKSHSLISLWYYELKPMVDKFSANCPIQLTFVDLFPSWHITSTLILFYRGSMILNYLSFQVLAIRFPVGFQSMQVEYSFWDPRIEYRGAALAISQTHTCLSQDVEAKIP